MPASAWPDVYRIPWPCGHGCRRRSRGTQDRCRLRNALTQVEQMSKQEGKSSRKGSSPKPAARPVDVVDGIPDRMECPARWRYVMISLVVITWTAVLLYCTFAGGGPTQ